MSRIEAYTQPLRSFHTVEDRRQVLNPVPQASPLPCRVLQSDAHGRLPGRGKNFVQTRGDLFDPQHLARSQVRAGVQHKKRKPELRGEFNFLDQ